MTGRQGHRRAAARPHQGPWCPALLAGVLLLAALGAGSGWASAGYEEVAAEVGVSFRLAGEVHDPSGEDTSWPAFPEIMGGGACWFDADGDGYDDLYLVNQAYNDLNPYVGSWAGAADPHNQLYLNDGDGTFTDHSAASKTDSRGFGYGCSAADYDHDGDVDLFVANHGDNELFRNRGNGTFDEVGLDAGVRMAGACGEFVCMSTSSAWADYDRDGDLDLFVGNYVDTTFTDTLRGPSAHVAQPNWLFRNDGDGTFTEVGQEVNVRGRVQDASGSKTLGVVWLDATLDGWPDLYVCNDSEPNEFHVNLGDGTFEDRADLAGVADHRSGMGCSAGDYDADGLEDLYMTHYASEHNGFYRNLGDGTFEDRSGEDGLAEDFLKVGWGTAFVDHDRDGDLDLVAVNGHTEWIVPGYGQAALVFRQDAPLAGADPWDAEWVDVSDDMGAGVALAKVSRGMATADYDRDGDSDMVVVNNANQTADVLRADTTGQRWLTVQLRQPGANPHGVGARVAVQAGGEVQWRTVHAGSSYLSQDTLDLEFGLGEAAQADAVTVHWPDGGTLAVGPLAADQVVRVDRATASWGNDTIAPVTTATLEGEAGEAGWWRSDVALHLEAGDRGVTWQSGVARSEAALGADAWTTAAGPFPVAGQGVHEVHYRSIDQAGNAEPRRTLLVGIDTEPPEPAHAAFEGEQGLEGWWVSPSVSVTLTAADALSGVRTFRYRIDAGPWNQVQGPFTVTGDGVHTVEAKAVDRAGNEGAITAWEVRIDSTAPAVALQRPAAGALYLGDVEQARVPGGGPATIVAPPAALVGEATRFTIMAEAPDATSGTDRVVFRIGAQVVHVDRAAPYTWPWPVTAWPAGLHEVEALAIDKAGNLRPVAVEVVVAHTSPPAPPATPAPPPLP